MLAPVADRPPAGVPGVTLALLSLIGREWKEAAEIALEYNYQPIRTLPSGNLQDRRPFYGLHDARLCLDEEGKVEEVLVPRPLTPEESVAAAENVRLLHHILIRTVYPRRHEPFWEDVIVQIMTDLYLLSFPVFCPTRAKITTFVYHRLLHNAKRTTRAASRRIYTERHVTPVGLSILHELADMPAPERAEPLIPDPAKAAELVRGLWPSESDRNVEIVVRRLGLAGPAQKLAEIAADFNITKERVRQIVARFDAAASRTPEYAETLRNSL